MHHPIHTNSHTLGCIIPTLPSPSHALSSAFTVAWHYTSMGQRAVKHLGQGKR
jgi:hypothetical protein